MKTKTTVKSWTPDPTSATTLSNVRAIMVTPTDENPASVCPDEIVHTLGEFPELTKAVRDGDLATVSILCAQLFDLDASRRTRLKARTTPKLNDVSPQ